MGWTKRQFVEQAFEEIGFAAYVYDLTADQLDSALRRLDSMMATWDAKGVQLGYPLTSNPQDSDLDTQTNVPDSANEAIYLNLGIRIAPSVGKVVSQETKRMAREAYRALLINIAMPQEMQLPRTLPSGAGNKPWRYEDPFLNTPDTSPIRLGDDGQLIFTEQ